ncbi:MAG: 4-hydroxythreonine-4-phosphate dehydrogenase PdxA [Magnetococcales bacterium]|nr:4-hydroxythreonine-4-phosphate dehydrogenase PdxA [Magnetococcales bacterium]MBF0151805.1 4-hydroxythreonine-4-phosphate dehydrogenase PdxA [Magnetococcales bacterium]MBF0632763.1 4-hydroxythreonine-4-phosphate dehydrogenase PdxA [Magnetococcales bacterium]
MVAGSALACLCGISLIAVSMGDPAGVGPELVLRGFSASPRRVHVGDPEVFRATARHFNLECNIREVDSPEAAYRLPEGDFAVLPVVGGVGAGHLSFGHPDPRFATVTVNSILECCRLAQSGRVAAMVTPPINKGVLHAAGYTFPGHTELIGSCAQVAHPVMMLVGRGLRVVPVTIHQSLASVASTLTRERLEQCIMITWRSLVRDFAIPTPRVTVAGLNPHAGEGGGFGREEQDLIIPVCDDLRSTLGPGLVGPLPADTLFHDRARAAYDAVILMYHDQALIPLKMLAFGEAVNVTLGLPFVRTSVDHGTAYDIAGKGIADHRSYHQALALATILAENIKRK